MTMAAARLSLFAAGLLGLTLIACTSEFTDYCDKKVACRAENDKDRNACVADREGDKAEAAAYGCQDAYKAYSECLDTSTTCQSGSFTSGSACSAASKVLSLCECQAGYRGAQNKCN